MMSGCQKTWLLWIVKNHRYLSSVSIVVKYIWLTITTMVTIMCVGVVKDVATKLVFVFSDFVNSLFKHTRSIDSELYDVMQERFIEAIKKADK